ncbi:MAG: hypothetical protein AMXMBFR4_09950 [Candidatus Hydrogenedentota bacterium]
MLCQKCHQSLATKRYAEVANGKVSELQVCDECLTRLQHGATSGFELTGVAPSYRRKSAPAEPAAAESVVPNRACKFCGTDLKEALQSGRVGCGSCYESLGEPLEKVLRGLHVGLRHRGKEPHLDDQRKRLRSELHSLRALLRSMLKSENYEEAAKLRDAIREKEEILKSREPENARSGSSRGHAENFD